MDIRPSPGHDATQNALRRGARWRSAQTIRVAPAISGCLDGTPPVNAAFRINALEVPDQQHPEVHPRSDAGPAQFLVVKLLAEPLNEAVETVTVEDLVELAIERMPRPTRWLAGLRADEQRILHEIERLEALGQMSNTQRVIDGRRYVLFDCGVWRGRADWRAYDTDHFAAAIVMTMLDPQTQAAIRSGSVKPHLPVRSRLPGCKNCDVPSLPTGHCKIELTVPVEIT